MDLDLERIAFGSVVGVTGAAVAAGAGREPWLACALGHKARHGNRPVPYQRVPKLFAELALARGDGRYARILRGLTGIQLLILDDWGLEPLDAGAVGQSDWSSFPILRGGGRNPDGRRLATGSPVRSRLPAGGRWIRTS